MRMAQHRAEKADRAALTARPDANLIRIAIAGGGAAGFFAAIAAARANPNSEVALFERTSQFLSKVRISGGGRCNITHALFEPLMFATYYPRGQRELIAPFHRFSAQDTVDWFEARGVSLKQEADGRMFPTTDSSETIVQCLIGEAKNAGVKLLLRKGIEAASAQAEGSFALTLSDGTSATCDRLLLATGGARSVIGAKIAHSLGHTIEAPVPSLFSLHIRSAWLQSLPGVSVSDVEVCVGKFCERGALLITHNGVSGPAVLRLSAWAARQLHMMDYHFSLRINWVPRWNEAALRADFRLRREKQPTKRVINSPIEILPARLWEKLVLNAGISPETIWTALSREGIGSLVRQMRETEFQVHGKSLNKDEFVTCGGVRLREINFKTMESRITPHLYFAGELLDIDGITGGFNFQAAWTTGWIAGHAMAGIQPTC
jgi:predicted Rossmann fold flavoprotein